MATPSDFAIRISPTIVNGLIALRIREKPQLSIRGLQVFPGWTGVILSGSKKAYIVNGKTIGGGTIIGAFAAGELQDPMVPWLKRPYQLSSEVAIVRRDPTGALSSLPQNPSDKSAPIDELALLVLDPKGPGSWVQLSDGKHWYLSQLAAVAEATEAPPGFMPGLLCALARLLDIPLRVPANFNWDALPPAAIAALGLPAGLTPNSLVGWTRSIRANLTKATGSSPNSISWTKELPSTFRAAQQWRADKESERVREFVSKQFRPPTKIRIQSIAAPMANPGTGAASLEVAGLIDNSISKGSGSQQTDITLPWGLPTDDVSIVLAPAALAKLLGPALEAALGTGSSVKVKSWTTMFSSFNTSVFGVMPTWCDAWVGFLLRLSIPGKSTVEFDIRLAMDTDMSGETQVSIVVTDVNVGWIDADNWLVEWILKLSSEYGLFGMPGGFKGFDALFKAISVVVSSRINKEVKDALTGKSSQLPEGVSVSRIRLATTSAGLVASAMVTTPTDAQAATSPLDFGIFLDTSTVPLSKQSVAGVTVKTSLPAGTFIPGGDMPSSSIVRLTAEGIKQRASCRLQVRVGPSPLGVPVLPDGVAIPGYVQLSGHRIDSSGLLGQKVFDTTGPEQPFSTQGALRSWVASAEFGLRNTEIAVIEAMLKTWKPSQIPVAPSAAEISGARLRINASGLAITTPGPVLEIARLLAAAVQAAALSKGKSDMRWDSVTNVPLPLLTRLIEQAPWAVWTASGAWTVDLVEFVIDVASAGASVKITEKDFLPPPKPFGMPKGVDGGFGDPMGVLEKLRRDWSNRSVEQRSAGPFDWFSS